MACLGIERQVNQQPVYVKELVAEAVYSALVGELRSTLGLVGQGVSLSFGQLSGALSSVVSDKMEGVGQTRIATGALIGVVAKATDGVRSLLTAGKKQNTSVTSIMVSWTIAALSGALGGQLVRG